MYKIILLDYSMPEMDGPQVAIEIRRLLTQSILFDNKDMPFLCCCTAYAEATFKRQALQAGMDQFLTKPINPSELYQILKNLNKDEENKDGGPEDYERQEGETLVAKSRIVQKK